MLKYLVIGSGLAGLYTAHRASALGSVLVVTKKALRDSNSFNAQGGIAAVTDIEDNPEIHFTDTVIAGRGLCENRAVQVLVQEGPQRIKEIIGEGMKFDTENGTGSGGRPSPQAHPACRRGFNRTLYHGVPYIEGAE